MYLERQHREEVIDGGAGQHFTPDFGFEHGVIGHGDGDCVETGNIRKRHRDTVQKHLELVVIGPGKILSLYPQRELLRRIRETKHHPTETKVELLLCDPRDGFVHMHPVECNDDGTSGRSLGTISRSGIFWSTCGVIVDRSNAGIPWCSATA